MKRASGLLLVLLAGCPSEIGTGATTSVMAGLIAPTDLSVEYDGGNRAVLRWIDHATDETGYRLEMSTTRFTNPSIADVRFLPANATTFAYPTMPKSIYYFRVLAITATMESDPSDELVAITPDVPMQPTGVDANPHTITEIRVSWGDVAGEEEYVIERQTAEGWIEVGKVPENATSFVSMNMAPDTEVAHRVVAIGPLGRSTPSDPVVSQTTTVAMSFSSLPLTSNHGTFTSIAVEPGGRQHLACYDVTNTDVLYGTRLAPGGFIVTTVDKGPTGFEDVGGDGTGIAVDAAGKVHVVAHDRTNNQLRYITNASGSWAPTTLDPSPSGAQPRVACVLNLIHVSHLGNTGSPGAEFIRHVYRAGANPWVLVGATVPSLPSARHALAVRPDRGLPYLLSVDPASRVRTYFGQWHGPIIPGPITMTWEPYPDFTPPVLPTRVDDAGLQVDETTQHLVFHEQSTGTLYYVKRDDLGEETAVVDARPGHDVGAFCALALDRQTGRLHVAYTDATTKDLWYARKDPGGRWVRRVIDALGDVGSHASIAVDGSGRVVIAYRDETARRLKVAAGAP